MVHVKNKQKKKKHSGRGELVSAIRRRSKRGQAGERATENSHLADGKAEWGWGGGVSFLEERRNVMRTLPSPRIPEFVLVGLMESERVAAERNHRNERPSKFDQTLAVPTVGSALEFNHSYYTKKLLSHIVCGGTKFVMAAKLELNCFCCCFLDNPASKG